MSDEMWSEENHIDFAEDIVAMVSHEGTLYVKLESGKFVRIYRIPGESDA